MEDLAPAIVMITLILTTGGVLLFRPLSKRLAELLHAMSQERLSPGPNNEIARLREQLAGLDNRLAQLEERQRFTESLLDGGSREVALLPEETAGLRPGPRALEGGEG